MLKVDSAVLPDGSTALYVTLVVPMSKHDPGSKLDDTVTSPELSVALGSVQFTIAKDCPKVENTEISSGRLSSVGASSSATFMHRKRILRINGSQLAKIKKYILNIPNFMSFTVKSPSDDRFFKKMLIKIAKEHFDSYEVQTYFW